MSEAAAFCRRFPGVFLAAWIVVSGTLSAQPPEPPTPQVCTMMCRLDGGGCCCQPKAPEDAGHDRHAGAEDAHAGHGQPLPGSPVLEEPWRPCPWPEAALELGDSGPPPGPGADAAGTLLPPSRRQTVVRGQVPAPRPRHGVLGLLPRPPPASSSL